MKTCDKCGNPRPKVLKVCGGCLAIERGEKTQNPLPLTQQEQRLAEAFLGKVNGHKGKEITHVKTYNDYFDDDGKQTKKLPKKWKDASRFKVGDKILFHGTVYNDAYKGKIGTVTEVRSGIGSFEGQWYNTDYECWVNESQGWLVVDFGFARPGYEVTKNGKRVPQTTVAVHMDDEGSKWERVK